MTAILRDSTTVVVVVRTRPRAIPLAMKTMRKSLHGLPLVSYMGMGIRLAALAAGAPLLIRLVLTEIQRLKKVKMYSHPDAVSDSVRMTIHFFVNFDIFKRLYIAHFWVYLHQSWDFVKLSLHFMTMWINSC